MSTLYFPTDGTVQGLYTEAIDLSALGSLKVTRAIRIEFDRQLNTLATQVASLAAQLKQLPGAS